MKLSSLTSSIKKATLLSALTLGLNTQQALSQNLKNPKLTTKEQALDSQVDKFIHANYDCVIDKSMFQDVGNVVDSEGVLTDEEEQVLETMIASLKSKNSLKVMIMTKDNISGSTLDFATELGRCLGIGIAKVNNGLVVIVDKKDRKSAIAPGYGVEGMITDAESSHILDQAKEYFKRDDIAGGLEQIIIGLQENITKGEQEGMAQKTSEVEKDFDPAVLGYIMAILFALTFLGISGYLLNREKEKYDALINSYNALQASLKKTLSKVTLAIHNLHETVNTIKDTHFGDAEWAKAPLLNLAQTGEKLCTRYEQSSSKLQAAKPITSSWSQFLQNHGKQIKNNIISYNNIAENADDILMQAHEISHDIALYYTIYSFYHNIIDTMNNKYDEISNITIDMNAKKNEGYIFPITEKNIDDTAIEVTGYLENASENIGNLEERKAIYDAYMSASQRLDDQVEGLQKTYDAYFANQKALSTIEENILQTEKKYETTLQQLSNIAADNIVQTYEDVYNNMLTNSLTDASDAKRNYISAYETKDIDKADTAFNAYKTHEKIIANDLLDLNNELEKQKNAKIEALELLENISTHLSKKIHPKYLSKAIVIQEQYDFMKNIGSTKRDRTKSLVIIGTMNSQITNIANQSISQYYEDNKPKSNHSDTNNNDNGYTPSPINDNMGGGSFGGGGSETTW